MDLGKISVLVLDVDGVLTTGAIVYSESGTQIHSFHVQDGHALKLWRSAGGRIAILSGRASPVVERRAKELGVEAVVQGRDDKQAAFSELLERMNVTASQVCYVGDDLPDLGPMRDCGFRVAVANATPPIKQIADYVTRRSGGGGALVEVIDLLLRKQRVKRGERK